MFVSSSKEDFLSQPSSICIPREQVSLLNARAHRLSLSMRILTAHVSHFSTSSLISEPFFDFFSSGRAKSCAMEKSFGIENGSNARQQ